MARKPGRLRSSFPWAVLLAYMLAGGLAGFFLFASDGQDLAASWNLNLPLLQLEFLFGAVIAFALSFLLVWMVNAEHRGRVGFLLTVTALAAAPLANVILGGSAFPDAPERLLIVSGLLAPHVPLLVLFAVIAIVLPRRRSAREKPEPVAEVTTSDVWAPAETDEILSDRRQVMKDIQEIRELVDDYERRINRLKEIESLLRARDTAGFEPDVAAIEVDLKKPLALDSVEERYAELCEKLDARTAWQRTGPGMFDSGSRLSKKAGDLFEQAKADMEAENYDPASRKLEEAISVAKEALTSFDGAIDLAHRAEDPQYVDAISQNRSRIHVTLASCNAALGHVAAKRGQQLFSDKDFDGSIAQFEEAKRHFSLAMEIAEANGMEEFGRTLSDRLAEADGNIRSCMAGSKRGEIEEIFSEGKRIQHQAKEAYDGGAVFEARALYAKAISTLEEAVEVAEKYDLKSELRTVSQHLQLTLEAQQAVHAEISDTVKPVEFRTESITLPDAPGASPGGIETIGMSLFEEKKTGKYQLLRPEGKGGMGNVWRAHDTVLKRDVAIKRLPPARLGDADHQDRLLREAQLAAQLAHPNIVRILDTERYTTEHGNQGTAIVMQFIDGSTLRELLRQEGSLSPSVCGGYLHQIAAALDYAHQAGVVHGDVKPSNIMVDKSNRVYLTDFGLARGLEGTTDEVSGETAVGFTPQYAAPEQWRKERVSPATDVYGLGITLYEMLTGERPFIGATQVLRSLHCERLPDPPSAKCSTLPPAVDEIILMCLKKEAPERYQRAQEVWDAFQKDVLE